MERKTERLHVRLTKKDKFIFDYLKSVLGLSTGDLIMKSIEKQYFTYVKQAENNYELYKKG